MKEKAAPDFFLMSVIMVLMGLGLITVYSSSAIYALDKFGSSTYFFWRQLIWTVIGFGTILFFISYDHRKLRTWVKPLLVACLVLLITVLVFGREIGGAKRWLRLWMFSFQPSELVKLALILFVAYYCDKKKSKIQSFGKGMLPLLIVLGVFCGLIFVQPDFGMPFLILLTCLTMFFVGGGKVKHLASLGIFLAPLIFLAVWMIPYRRERIFAFLNPWEDTQGSSYQLVQSLLALGSGGLTGVGLGDSRSKLLYLPEPHTDFIFPIFGEEFGLLGSWTVLLLFGMVAWFGFRIAARSTSLFSSLVACGITVMTLYQVILNIAMVTGCLPTKGLPLPFFSFGGSSLIVTMAGMGILLNISRTIKKTK